MKKEKNKGLYLAFKIITFVAFVAIVVSTVLYFVDISKGEKSFFTQHFSIPIDLFLVGIIAMILPQLNKKTLQGENKGDFLMILVGVALIILSFISLGLSFS